MAYIWENYNLTRKYCLGKDISPYLEILTENDRVCHVNPLIRFPDLFNDLDQFEDLGHAEELRQCIREKVELSNYENILFHYLAHLDLLKGTNERQIEINYLDEKIKKGAFGDKVRQAWKTLRFKEREKILYILLDKLELQKMDNYFIEVVRKLYREISVIYENSTDTYYLYINELRTDYNESLLEAVIYLFWDIQCRLQVVWDKHYGIIGSDNTMLTSEIQIL